MGAKTITWKKKGNENYTVIQCQMTPNKRLRTKLTGTEQCLAARATE